MDDAARKAKTEQRLYRLNAWRETPYYSERERAALGWAEVVTRFHKYHVPDEVYERVRQQFKEAELINLTLADVAINGWNRLAISFRSVPGSYQRTFGSSAG